MSNDNMRKFVLEKLYRKRYIGGRHTSLDNVPKSLPPHIRKDALNITKELIKEGLILHHPTSYGIQISLNPRRIKEIEEIIRS